MSPKPGVLSIDDRAPELFATGEKFAYSHAGGGVRVRSATGELGAGEDTRVLPREDTLPITAAPAAFSLAITPGDCEFGAGLS